MQFIMILLCISLNIIHQSKHKTKKNQCETIMNNKNILIFSPICIESEEYSHFITEEIKRDTYTYCISYYIYDILEKNRKIFNVDNMKIVDFYCDYFGNKIKYHDNNKKKYFGNSKNEKKNIINFFRAGNASNMEYFVNKMIVYIYQFYKDNLDEVFLHHYIIYMMYNIININPKKNKDMISNEIYIYKNKYFTRLFEYDHKNDILLEKEEEKILYTEERSYENCGIIIYDTTYSAVILELINAQIKLIKNEIEGLLVNIASISMNLLFYKANFCDKIKNFSFIINKMREPCNFKGFYDSIINFIESLFEIKFYSTIKMKYDENSKKLNVDNIVFDRKIYFEIFLKFLSECKHDFDVNESEITKLNNSIVLIKENLQSKNKINNFCTEKNQHIKYKKPSKLIQCFVNLIEYINYDAYRNKKFIAIITNIASIDELFKKNKILFELLRIKNEETHTVSNHESIFLFKKYNEIITDIEYILFEHTNYRYIIILNDVLFFEKFVELDNFFTKNYLNKAKLQKEKASIDMILVQKYRRVNEFKKYTELKNSKNCENYDEYRKRKLKYFKKVILYSEEIINSFNQYKNLTDFALITDEIKEEIKKYEENTEYKEFTYLCTFFDNFISYSNII